LQIVEEWSVSSWVTQDSTDWVVQDRAENNG